MSTPSGIPTEPAATQPPGPGPDNRRTRRPRRLRRGHLMLMAVAGGAVLAVAVAVPAKLATTAITTGPARPSAGTPAATLTHPSGPALQANRLRGDPRGRPAGAQGRPSVVIPATTLTDPPPAPAAASGSQLYDNIRFSNGAWQGWAPPAQPSGGVTGGWSRMPTPRRTCTWTSLPPAACGQHPLQQQGTWQGWAQPPSRPARFSSSPRPPTPRISRPVASTSSGLYFSERAESTGAWRAGGPLIPAPGSGGIGDMSASVSANGGVDQLQVAVVLTGGQLWHNVYGTEQGTWQGWAQPATSPAAETP